MTRIRFARALPAALAAAIAVSLAPVSAHAASVVPSIEITGVHGSASGSCDSSSVDVNIILNNPGAESDNYEITSGTTLLYRWTGEHYGGVGADTYGLSGTYSAAQPANTHVTGTIYTFPTGALPAAPYTPDKYSYASAITWDCTTGEVISIVNSVGNGAVATAVPTLEPGALGALGLLVAAAAGFARGGRRGRSHFVSL